MPEAVSVLREPRVVGDRQLADVTTDIARPLEGRPTRLWWIGFLVAGSMLLLGIVAVAYQFVVGIGTWGLNRTVGWAFDITNFVFWVGIGHAGTLISAVLFLFRQRWRTAVNRSAEAMTIFAVMCAGLFPLIHMGPPWLAFWVFPYPNTRGSLWVNWRSPLLWDVFAISTYFIISLVFWYVGLLPDLATLRDRTTSRLRRAVFGVMSFGWNGSSRTWHRYAHAEEDHKALELISSRNQCDAIIHSVKKSLKEHGDQLSSDEKAKIETALKDAEEVLKTDKKEDIDAKTQALTEAAHKLAEKMYQQKDQQDQQAQPESGSSSKQGEKPVDGEVVDAEFEEVKNKK